MTTPELAHCFTVRLRDLLTEQQWLEMRAKNASGGYKLCCASHDYLDANMVMAAAFRQVHGREADFTSEGDADISDWNAAWALARATTLTDMPKMSDRMRDLARHALGLPNARRRTYRNHFCTGEGDANWHEWMMMTAAGFATKHNPSWIHAGNSMFRLTRAGANAALDTSEQLCAEDWKISA